jgi:hypothetical protein
VVYFDTHKYPPRTRFGFVKRNIEYSNPGATMSKFQNASVVLPGVLTAGLFISVVPRELLSSSFGRAVCAGVIAGFVAFLSSKFQSSKH